MENQSFDALLNSRNFDQSAELRLRVMTAVLYLMLLDSAVYVVSYIVSGQYGLIPWLLIPFLLPTLLFFYIIKRTQSYRASLLFILYLYSVLGLTRLLAEPTYLVDLFLFPTYIGTAFLSLKLRHAVWSVIYLLALFIFSTLVVYYWAPFELLYTNDNISSITSALVLSLVFSFTLFFVFAQSFQRNSILLGDVLLSLKKTNDDNKLLISVFSHDFRNYLMRVLLQIEYSKQQCSDESQVKSLESIEESIHRLSALLTEVQDVRNLFDGNRSDSRTVLACRELLKKTELIFRHQLLLKNLVLDTSGCEDVHVESNADVLVHMILANLIGNAIKFSPAGATISMATSRDATGTTLSITNYAEDTHAENLRLIAAGKDKVNSKAGTTDEYGQGLGLGIVRRFCRMQDIRFDIKVVQEPGTKLLKVEARLGFA